MTSLITSNKYEKTAEQLLTVATKSQDERDGFLRNAETAETITFWMQGKAFSETKDAIQEESDAAKAAKVEGIEFERELEFKSFNEFCKAYELSFGTEKSGVTNLVYGWKIVEALYSDGISIDDLPKKLYYAQLLKKFNEEDRTNVWNEFLASRDIETGKFDTSILKLDPVKTEEASESDSNEAPEQQEENALKNAENAAEELIDYLKQGVQVNPELIGELKAIFDQMYEFEEA